MFIAGSNDDLYTENALIFEPATVQRLRHFATAIFGYYLQGKQEYAEYISEEAINQLEGMLWGMYGEN